MNILFEFIVMHSLTFWLSYHIGVWLDGPDEVMVVTKFRLHIIYSQYTYIDKIALDGVFSNILPDL